MTDDRPAREGFLDRRMTRRWGLILFALAVVAGLIAWSWQALRTRGVAREADEALRAQASQTAEVTARSIATFGNEQIVAEDWGALQRAADELVSQRPLSYIAIANARGAAVVHTDRSLRGKRLPRLKESDEMAEITVPAMNSTRQVATIRVGVKVPER